MYLQCIVLSATFPLSGPVRSFHHLFFFFRPLLIFHTFPFLSTHSRPLSPRPLLFSPRPAFYSEANLPNTTNTYPLFPPSPQTQALISPFIQRLYDFADGDILPTSLPAKLDKLPNFSKWAKACRSHDSVAFNWEPRMKLQMMKGRIAKMRPVSTD